MTKAIILSREQQLQIWAEQQLAIADVHLQPVSGDASFRRYFRISHAGQTWIAVDAPPQQEDSAAFISIARYLAQHGVLVPEILAQDLEQGFLLVSDFGDRLLLTELQQGDADQLYQLAINSLLKIQVCSDAQTLQLPLFDAKRIYNDLQPVVSWFLEKELQLILTSKEQSMFEDVFQALITGALAQTQLLMHRDYHSRNLMVINSQQLGVLDFQSAMIGPVCYDLLSLLRDCYIDWPIERVEQWVVYYYDQAKQAGIVKTPSLQLFLDEFYLLSIQRHLKAIGTFARLNQQQNKSAYLKDIPRVLNYLLDSTQRFEQFKSLHRFLLERVLPLSVTAQTHG